MFDLLAKKTRKKPSTHLQKAENQMVISTRNMVVYVRWIISPINKIMAIFVF